MNAEFFLDTNVLIYAFSPQDGAKKLRSQKLFRQALATGDGIISFQVVQEFLNVAQRKFPGQFTPDELTEYLEVALWPLCKIFPSAELYQRALSLRTETGFSFYDSLMVAAALEADCKIIYSEDLQHNRRLHGLQITTPFL
jgi:predicted nucleic acid-binding protein